MTARYTSPLMLPLGAALLAACLLSGSALAQGLTVVEPGFTVTDLGDGFGPKGATCSPGGVWGPYVYIAESNGDAVERIDFADNMTIFASGAPDIDFPVGIEFGPGPAADFGTYVYVASYESDRITRLDPSGTPSLFTTLVGATDLAFDPSGGYSNELYAATFYGPIHKVSSLGVVTPFAAFSSLYIKFGPGGAWGTGMYATSSGGVGTGIVTVAPDGTETLFSGGFTTPEQFDWADGAFGGDMFATDFGTGEVWRIAPDGTRTLFATVDPQERPAGLVYCNGCLYITSFGGGCWKVCESPVPTEAVTWGTLKQTYRSEP